MLFFCLQGDLPAKPLRAAAHAPELTATRLFVCPNPNCRALYSADTSLRDQGGGVTTCAADVADRRRISGYGPCGTPLAEAYRSIAGKPALRPVGTYSVVDVKDAVARLWQDYRFASFVLHHDARRKSSFWRTPAFADILRDHPDLAKNPGTLFVSLYLDYFNFFEKPGSSVKAQIGALLCYCLSLSVVVLIINSARAGAIWLRIENLPPEYSIKGEFCILLATLTGAWRVELGVVVFWGAFLVIF